MGLALSRELLHRVMFAWEHHMGDNFSVDSKSKKKIYKSAALIKTSPYSTLDIMIDKSYKDY